jgi:hypothetical protein
MQSSDAFIPKYSELVYNGFWFSPEREAIQALVTETQPFDPVLNCRRCHHAAVRPHHREHPPIVP